MIFDVVIVDHPGSGAPDFRTLTAYAAAMQKGMADFGEVYGRTVAVRYGDAKDIQPSDKVLGLFADPDQPGALGYHDPSGMGKVFPLLDAQDGVELSTTIDHELKELAQDLLCDLSRFGKNGQFWADEPCDAVEQGKYAIDGVSLSNFVLPSWYSGAGSKFDLLGTLAAPLTVDAGGYAQWFDAAKGWQQLVHAEVAPRPYRLQTFGRSARRRARVRMA